MADKQVKSWITIKGRHIPLFEGETKADAIKRLKESKPTKGPAVKKATVKKKESQPKKEDHKEESKERIKKALDYAKEKIDKQSYSWKETVLDAEYEHKLKPEETKALEHAMKAYAIKHDKFKDQHDKWKKEWKEQGFNYDAYTAGKKKLEQVHAPEDLLAGEHYTNKLEYKIKSDWIKEHSQQYMDDKKERSEAYKQLVQAKDKHLDPEMVSSLGKDLARTLVNEKEYPDIMELREKYDRINARVNEYEDKQSRYTDYFEQQDRIHSKMQRNEYGRPEFEKAVGEYPGFKAKESTVPYYDDLVKQGKAEVVEMTPEEYIKECAYYIFSDSTYEKTLRGRVGDEDTLKYAKMMREGVKFDTPYLNYKDEAQEGLHRAVAAYVNGIKKMPVIIVGKRRNN